MMREPVVASQFYPGTKTGLERTLGELIRKNEKKQKVIGAISPHAGYVYSGGVAGSVFSVIAPRELFIVIGPNHTGAGRPFSISTEETWKTPIGNVEIDKELASYLAANSALLEEDSLAHRYEHSIEVQIPFLQFIADDFKVLPLCVGSLNIGELKKVG